MEEQRDQFSEVMHNANTRETVNADSDSKLLQRAIDLAPQEKSPFNLGELQRYYKIQRSNTFDERSDEDIAQDQTIINRLMRIYYLSKPDTMSMKELADVLTRLDQ